MKFFLAKANIIFLVLLIGCGRNVEEIEQVDCDNEPVTYEIIWMTNMAVQNATITIKPGDTIRWIWGEGGMPHDVTSDDPNAPEDFGSGILIGEGQVYEYTFTEEITFEYRCSIHPNSMVGTISVIACEENTSN
ncbi:MAG TPA: plastocyanin/azurin family copper-binding protein [Flavobacteriaceae bacterium]|nr:plastocyanin/azurin family copper-binding protein [Flavobacteriaceae bacterium]